MNPQILLVEDNPSDAKLTRIAFKRSGLANEIVLVSDGAEALSYLFREGSYATRDPVPPALMLLDLNLPRIDGLEVLRRLRADPHLRFLPVVILTSSKEQEDIVTSYALGANAYVRKPVDFNAFVDAVRTLGLFWLVLNERPASE